MDLVGPLEQTAQGHLFVLVVMDYAMYYAAYLDGIIIYSNDLQRHFQHDPMRSLRQEGPTANPKKYATGQVEV